MIARCRLELFPRPLREKSSSAWENAFVTVSGNRSSKNCGAKTLLLLAAFCALPFCSALAQTAAGDSSTCPVLRVPSTFPSSARFAKLDDEVRRGLGTGPKGHYAGAVLVVAYRGEVVHAAAFGEAQSLTLDAAGKVRPLTPPRPMQIDTIFDMASVTKIEATTAALLHLVDSGKLHLDDRLGTLLPEFAHTDKAAITLRQLLTHRSGLWEWQPVWFYRDAQGKVIDYLAGLPLQHPVGAQWAYSDLGFMLLGEIVVRTSGMPLDRYVKQEIYAPLGMSDTGFLQPSNLRSRIAATSKGDLYQRAMAETGKPYPVVQKPRRQTPPKYRTNFLVGEVNDANSWLGWEGVAGHAGLFSTALDLARYAQTLVNGGCAGSWRLASPATLAQFEQTPYDPTQALGFRKISVANTSAVFYGHTGFTGTAFMFSPKLGLSVVLLTNRVHRDEHPLGDYPSLTAIRKNLLEEAVAAVKDSPGK